MVSTKTKRIRSRKTGTTGDSIVFTVLPIIWFSSHITESLWLTTKWVLPWKNFRGKVLSAETDRDHIHLLVSLPPNTNISVFVRSIKTQLSREMRKRFPEQIKQYIYGDDTSFWSRSYFIATTGSVSLETVKQYIESQRSEEHQAKKNQQLQKKTLLEWWLRCL